MYGDAQAWVDSIRRYEAESREWKRNRVRYGRNVRGLIAHNLLVHVDARHGGTYEPRCGTCLRIMRTYDAQDGAK